MIVTEVDPIKAIEAVMDGFEVMPMDEAAKLGDYFLTVTGDIDIITERHFMEMKDGAICANAGHFDCEVSRKDLERICTRKFEARKNIEGYVLPNGKTVFLMAEGVWLTWLPVTDIRQKSWTSPSLCRPWLPGISFSTAAKWKRRYTHCPMNWIPK